MIYRYIFYFILAVAFALFDWYSLWVDVLPLSWWWIHYAIWMIPALCVALAEIHLSRRIHRSAFVTAIFWLTTILVYYLYYIGTVMWPSDEPYECIELLLFIRAAILPSIVEWGLIALIGGLVLGYGVSACYLFFVRQWLHTHLSVSDRSLIR